MWRWMLRRMLRQGCIVGREGEEYSIEAEIWGYWEDG